MWSALATPGRTIHSASGMPAAMTSVRRRLHIAAARIGRTKNTTMRVMLPPSGLATRKSGTEATAVMAADRRSTRAVGGSTITSPMHDAMTPANAAPRNGNTPGSGNSADAMTTGAIVSTAMVTGASERGRLAVASPEPQVDHDAAERDAEEHAGDRAGQRRERGGDQPEGGPPRSYASSATRPNASPSANGSRPTARLTAVPTANQQAAATPAVPK